MTNQATQTYFRQSSRVVNRSRGRSEMRPAEEEQTVKDQVVAKASLTEEDDYRLEVG